jgi:hypothetical protein
MAAFWLLIEIVGVGKVVCDRENRIFFLFVRLEPLVYGL